MDSSYSANMLFLVALNFTKGTKYTKLKPDVCEG